MSKKGEFVCPHCGDLRMVGVQCRLCRLRRASAWRKANPEKERVYKLKYRNLHRERYNELRRRRRNPETSRKSLAARRLWLAAGDATKEQLRELVKRSGSACCYCKEMVVCRCEPLDPRGFDHVLARSLGGLHTIGNIVVSCRHCNAIKQAGSPDRIAERRAILQEDELEVPRG